MTVTTEHGDPHPLVRHVRDTLEAAGLEVSELRELPTGHGWQLRCAGGEMVCVYRTGRLVPQGRNPDMVRRVLDAAGAPPDREPAAAPRHARGATSPSTHGVTSPATRGTTPSCTSLPGAVAAPAIAPDATARLPDGWTTAPWDGTSLPWRTEEEPCASGSIRSAEPMPER